MATKSSDLDDQKTGVNIQTKGHTLTLPSSWNGPEDTEAFDSTPSHSPSLSLVRKPTPDCPKIQYCLEIQVISTRDGENYITTPTCLAGTSCGRQGLRWQIWHNRSSSDQAWLDHPVLWAVIIRRRTELGQGMRHHIHSVRNYLLGW